MISKRLLRQAAYRHYRRSNLLSILAEYGQGWVYVLRTVLGNGSVQPQGKNWATIGVKGLLAAFFMDGTPATADSDDPISECSRCWSQLFERPQERLKT
ncbi:MAG: hypothetical protein Q9P01_00620 [Anaerolineae bacterium]|nr:hypothetical protein [Anaerolineae bacterium]MDQ7033372.1 hypothetical protein [Anaerolineae bacterium]